MAFSMKREKNLYLSFIHKHITIQRDWQQLSTRMANIYLLTNWVMLLSSQKDMTEWTISKMALAKYIAKTKFGRLTEKAKR